MTNRKAAIKVITVLRQNGFEALLAGGDIPIDGFLCPGPVSVIIGAGAYGPIAADHGKRSGTTAWKRRNWASNTSSGGVSSVSGTGTPCSLS